MKIFPLLSFTSWKQSNGKNVNKGQALKEMIVFIRSNKILFFLMTEYYYGK